MALGLSWTTPRDNDLGLKRVSSAAGIAVSLLPNGSVFAIEHESQGGRIMINQQLGSPVGGGIARLYLRLGGAEPSISEAAKARCGVAADRILWEEGAAGIDRRVTLWLAPDSNIWLWRVEITNRRDGDIEADAILIQDLGLGERGSLMNNEAYASQYIDHHVGHDQQCGAVIMSRQNLAHRGSHPWVLHGCLDGAAGFATDAMQVFGPAFRDADVVSCGFGQSLPSERLQHEVACAALQSRATRVRPGSSAAW